MRRCVAIFGLLLALLATACPAHADRRVALLIGNGKYAAVGTLANPRNDVVLLKQALDVAGFDEVRTAFDLGHADLVKALRAFTDAARDADIALVYYSGHGLEMGGANYLVPVDATLATDDDVADETVTLDRVMKALEGAKRLKLVILDACRTNPFLATMTVKSGQKAIEKGLAPVEPRGSDTLIAFAAKAGTPAEDGVGENSPFAAALAKRLIAPGVDVEIALREVRDDVLAATHNRQEPYKYGSLGGSTIPLSKVAPSQASGAGDTAQQVAFDAAMTADTREALDAFLAKYPVGWQARIARNERDRLDRPSREAALKPAPVPTPALAGPCGGVTALASLSLRGVGVLSRDETCALKRGDVFKECADCPAMVVIPAGSFTMGSPASEPGRGNDEGPQHVVKFAHAFAVGEFDVTKNEFAAFVRETGYDAGASWRETLYAPTGSHPVIEVNWDDAQAYVKWLSKKTGQPYRLLSESEWEYSARAGTTTAYFWGDAVGVDQADCAGCGSRLYDRQTAPVGSFAPNAFGLYDMHGNVGQWVQDCYSDTYNFAPDDGSPITSGKCSRVVRGGSWGSSTWRLRAADRDVKIPTNRYDSLGFRVARTLLP